MPVLVLVIILASANEAEPSAGTWIAQGARDALGQDARVLVEPRSVLPADAEALALAEGARASVVVEVRWQGAGHHSVHLHMHTADVASWFDRDIAFAREDDLADRDRTLGLAIGAMVTQSSAVAQAAPAPPAAAPSPAPATGRAATPLPKVGPALNPSLPSPGPSPDSPLASEVVRPFAASLEGMVAASLGGDGTTFGGAFLAGWSPTPALQVHVEALARSTSFGALGASSITIGSAAGITWDALLRRFVAVGPRVDLVALHDDVRLETVGGVQHRTQWVPACDLLMQGEWRPNGFVALSLALGAEVALGTARIYWGDQRIATVTPVRAIVLLGATMRF